MIPENGNINLFERYRNGELSEAELKNFEARLVYDSEFKEAFEQYEQIEAGIKNHFRKELKLKLQELDQTMDEPSKKSSVAKLILWASSVAAILIVGFFIAQHFSTNTNVQLAEQYWPYEEGLPVRMSTKGKYDDAMNAYKLENWGQAELLFSKIDSDTSDYFLGIVNYQQNDFQKAIFHFNQVREKSAYFQEAQFRMALVLLAKKNENSAKRIFQDQIDNKTEFAIKSKQLLSDLKKK